MSSRLLNLQPELKGTLIRLRPLAAEDFEPLYAVAADPLIWEQHPENTRYRRDVFEAFFAKAMQSRGAFAILDNSTSEIIGSSRYYDYDPGEQRVFVGFTFMARRYWGGIYNRELKHLMLVHAFQHVDRVLFHVGIGNMRSQKALLKIGAERISNSEDTVIFEIERRRYASVPARAGES